MLIYVWPNNEWCLDVELEDFVDGRSDDYYAMKVEDDRTDDEIYALITGPRG